MQLSSLLDRPLLLDRLSLGGKPYLDSINLHQYTRGSQSNRGRVNRRRTTDRWVFHFSEDALVTANLLLDLLVGSKICFGSSINI